MDGWTSRLIDRSMHCPVEGREIWIECVYEIESEDCVMVGGRSTHFEISSCAIDLIDGAQCKFKRKH